MATLTIKKFGDLFAQAQGATEAVIECVYKRIVVRKLRLEGNEVVVDAMEPPIVRVSVDEPVTYEPWSLDRGSLLFLCRQLNMPRAKLATEFDELVYPDGRRFTLEPARS